MAEEKAICEVCGEPMPPGETMFKFHGYSGPCPKPPLIKTLDDMTEPELAKLTDEVLNGVKAKLPAGTCFTVLFWPFGQPGIGQYGSNAERSDMIKGLREVADRLERRQDFPR